VRDYVFVRDVATANVLALTRGTDQIINLGSERGTSVRELFTHLQPLTGFSGAAKLAPPRPGEIQKIYLSGARARQELGWSATVPVADGLRQTVDWVKRVAQGGAWRD
jgi:UDP-glucose 4-epimerase